MFEIMEAIGTLVAPIYSITGYFILPILCIILAIHCKMNRNSLNLLLTTGCFLMTFCDLIIDAVSYFKLVDTSTFGFIMFRTVLYFFSASGALLFFSCLIVFIYQKRKGELTT